MQLTVTDWWRFTQAEMRAGHVGQGGNGVRKKAEGPEHCVLTEVGKNACTCEYGTPLVHRKQSRSGAHRMVRLQKDAVGTPQHLGIVTGLKHTAGRAERLEQGHSLGID